MRCHERLEPRRHGRTFAKRRKPRSKIKSPGRVAFNEEVNALATQLFEGAGSRFLPLKRPGLTSEDRTPGDG